MKDAVCDAGLPGGASVRQSHSVCLYAGYKAAHLMPRKLKSYQTSLGFFDLAVAAPSMKAAAEAWGSRPDDFKRGFAKRTDDPAIVAATMAKLGVVLRRPVGSKGTFIEHAKLPKDLPLGAVKEKPEKPGSTTKEPPSKLHDKDAREAALAFAREQKQRNRARQKQEAAREKERKRRELVKAQRALEQAHSVSTSRVTAFGGNGASAFRCEWAAL